MPAGSDDDVEYLDDPISLVTFGDIKPNICDTDQIIDLGESSDEENVWISSYGKKSFVLPVTFFDIPRNVRLLKKCRPMSIRIVDCKQNPADYSKYIREKTTSQPVDGCAPAVNNKSDSHCENNPNNANVEDNVINNTKTIDKDGKIQDREKKRIHPPKGDSFYEKLEKRRERRKQIALNCKDLSQLDFKRNKGLVGLKITGNILKEIVHAEKAVQKRSGTKSISGENKFRDNSGRDRDKTLDGTKNKLVEDRCKEITKTDAEKQCIDYCKVGKDKEKRVTNVQKIPIDKKSDCIEKKRKEKTETDTGKVFIKTKTDFTVDKHKEKNRTDTEKALITTKSTSTLISKERSEIDTKQALIDAESVVHKFKEKCENNLYLKTVGATLDNLGTSLIRIEDTDTNIHKPKDVNQGGRNKTNTIKGDTTPVNTRDKLENSNGNNDVRCSLKISCKIIEKGLKPKHSKSDNKHSDISKTAVEQNRRRKTNSGQLVPKLNLKRKNDVSDGFYVVTDKEKQQSKSLKIIEVPHSSETKQVEKSTVKDTNINDGYYLVSAKDKQKSKSLKKIEVPYSTETKQVEKCTVKNANRDQAGSNSPVIPCKTITVRSSQPKLSPNIPLAKNTGLNKATNQNITTTNWSKPDIATSHNTLPLTSQKSQINNNASKNNQNIQNKPSTTELTNVCLLKQRDLSKDSTLKHSLSQSNTPNVNIKPKSSSQNLNRKTIKAAIYYPDMCTQKPTVTENKSDQNMSKMNPTKGPVIKSASTGNIVPVNNVRNLTKSHTDPNPQPSQPIFKQPIYAYSGRNAIIFRKPPAPLQKNTPSNLGQPIQTVVNNRPEYQPMPIGVQPVRFKVPQYPPPTTNIASVRATVHNFLPQWRMPNACFQSQQPVYPYPDRWRPMSVPLPPPPPPPPPPVPPPSTVQPSTHNFSKNNLGPPKGPVSKDSIIGSNANGELIKKINIIAKPVNTVNDKEMMLAELNNAVMSPELNKPVDQSNELKRNNDSKAESANPKYSKPCPLSKKHRATDSNKVKIPEKPPPNIESTYSPPILPILTYEEILSRPDKYTKKGLTKDSHNLFPFKLTKLLTAPKKANNMEPKRKIPQMDGENQAKAKKISFEDYRKRVTKDDVDRIEVNKIRKPNVADDYNHDQGYDSDSTVKLYF